METSMSVKNLNNQQKKLLGLVLKRKLSSSHEVDHLLKVAEYSQELSRQYKADIGIVVAAALVHDLGRSNTQFRGGESAREGARLSREVLLKAGYSGRDIEMITACVEQHDQPKLVPNTLEAKILKEADFLDGFGARGILRSLVYAGETGGGVPEGVERLKVKMKQRFESLSFIESKRLAWPGYWLVQVFLDELTQRSGLESVTYAGKLVALEGISGSGKDTQAKKLASMLKKSGTKVVVINHPTAFLKQKIWKAWRNEANDTASELLIIMADRMRIVNSTIKPALKRGEVVISTRSGLDARIYQENEQVNDSLIAYMFSFEPLPDVCIYLDLSPETAWKRILAREARGSDDKGFFAQRQNHQIAGFRRVLKEYPHVVKINAEKPAESVAEEIWLKVRGLLH